MPTPCLLCGHETPLLLDFGPQPICNRFLADPGAREPTHPLGLGQCPACGLIQLGAPVAAAELRPRYDWISYNEPERHLDQLARIIAGLPGLAPDAVILGTSSKDDSLLRRLAGSGFSRVRRLDPLADLGITAPAFGVETIQDRILPAAERVISNHGRADLIIARHILEHAHAPAAFLRALIGMLKADGCIIIEAPDYTPSLETQDYSTVWEEHVLYFTPATFRDIFPAFGLTPVYYESFPYATENALVGIGRIGTPPQPAPRAWLPEEQARMATFAGGLAQRRNKLRDGLLRFKNAQGKVALFGSGHLACAFVNILGLKDALELVIDDNPRKQGLFMPGSRLPIRCSKNLLTDGIKLCLLSVNPESEDTIIAKNKEFAKEGGRFLSIFPRSGRAWKI